MDYKIKLQNKGEKLWQTHTSQFSNQWTIKYHVVASLFLGGGISNKTIDLTPMRFGVWVIDKEDAIAGNKKNVHFSHVSFLQLTNLIDDLDKGDFSRFPVGGDVLNQGVIDYFVYTKVAPSFGLRFKGYKLESELTNSEKFINGYLVLIMNSSDLKNSSKLCYAPSMQGMSAYSIVDSRPTQSGNYLYCNAETGENELIVINK